MIRNDNYYNMQSDILDDNRNSVRSKVFYTYLCSFENDSVDSYGEWFDIGMDTICSITNYSVRMASKAINQLRHNGYIDVIGTHSKSINSKFKIRIIPLEERKERGLRL